MDINLANLLRESLLLAGCSEEMVDGFDDNSTIALEFNDQSEMYLLFEKDKNRIVAWSPICESNENVLSTHAFFLLQKLIQPVHYSDSEQLYLKQSNGQIHLHCIFNNDYVETPEMFLDALSNFFDIVQECTEAMR